MVLKQVEQTCVFHKICVAFITSMTIGRIPTKIKLIHVTTVFVLESDLSRGDYPGVIHFSFLSF